MSNEQSIEAAEGKPIPPPKMTLYVVPEPLILALREYLGKRPYDEVADLIEAMKGLNTATLQPADKPAPKNKSSVKNKAPKQKGKTK